MPIRVKIALLIPLQVTKEPLELYIGRVTGKVKYTAVGWCPSDAITEGFYCTDNNPLHRYG